ncbi:AlpA family transcriptional regulator [Pseudoxanthomonas sp. SGT-18]|jgi:Predicted transcriptional regulator|uniref:helix-turn-helix transcriptional regulator n=1 Tax=Pseudoxanthomonas sp. SGT-18 TaxID=2493087 RepID=UPI000F62ABAC|nr:AlpA family transcriptional regulator [Pseudoxanthomonas sp. SGT-18]
MHSTATNSTAPRLIRLKEVQRLTGLARSTIYAKMADGTFPKQRKVSPTIAVWSEAEVLAWIANVLQQSNDGEPMAA